MAVRKVVAQLEVEVPPGADISTVDRLVYETGRRAMAEAFAEAALDESEPEGCPGCGERGR